MRAVGEYEGNVLMSLVMADEGLFSADELQLMAAVCDKLGGRSSRQVLDLSHREKGWLDCHNSHGMIPFEAAFALKGM